MRTAQACENLAPWSRLPETGAHFFSPIPLALTAGALAAPAVMAPTGIDHELRLVSQESLGGSPNQEAISVWAPYVLSGALVVTDGVALVTGECELARPASAMVQAVVLTVVTTGALKWVTGRAWPNDGDAPDAPDRLEHPEHAQTFRWFEWKSGYAWPSGHTATMFSLAAALGTVTEHQHWTGYAAYAAATGVAAGMWLGDHHWASDIVSGVLLGIAVGRSAGLSFRSERPEEQSLLLLPWSDSTTLGARAIGSF
jgi:membrane-associated phospholipid phosphatase